MKVSTLKSVFGMYLVLFFSGQFAVCLAQDEGPFDESEPPFAPSIKRRDQNLEKVDKAPPIPKVKESKSKRQEASVDESQIQKLEQQLYELVNKDRAKFGQGPLKLDPLLCKMAKAHADDMLKKKYFSHTNKEGLDAQERAQRMGIGRGVYENIAYQQGDIEKSQMVITLQNDFMSEPEGEKNHRYNILHPDHCCVGVGVVVSGEKLILVEEFTDSEPGSD